MKPTLHSNRYKFVAKHLKFAPYRQVHKGKPTPSVMANPIESLINNIDRAMREARKNGGTKASVTITWAEYDADLTLEDD